MLTVGDQAGSLSVLRSLRLMRIFKLVARWKQLNEMISIIARSVSKLSYLFLLMVLYMFVFALLGKQFFSARPLHAHARLRLVPLLAPRVRCARREPRTASENTLLTLCPSSVRFLCAAPSSPPPGYKLFDCHVTGIPNARPLCPPGVALKDCPHVYHCYAPCTAAQNGARGRLGASAGAMTQAR